MNVRSYLLALLVGSTAASVTFADSPFDKFIPRGRLLRKLRDDIIGPPEPAPAEAQAQAAGKNRVPTPAVRPGTGQPTPAGRPPQQFQRPGSSNAQARPTGTSFNGRRPTGPATPAKRTAANREGFGMAVEADKDDRVIVTQVLPGGNAAEAGLQRGDVIVAAGGVDLGSIEEFREITKIMGAGDQLDFKVARRGRESTLTLQHGQPPQLPDEDQLNGAPRTPSTEQSSASAGRRGRVTPQQTAGAYRGNFEFVPPADDHSASGMRSVLDSPIIEEPISAPVRTHVPARPASMSGAMNHIRSQPRPQQPSRQLRPSIVQQQQQIRDLEQRLQLLQRQQGPTGSGLQTQRYPAQ